MTETYYKSFQNGEGLSLYGHMTWPLPNGQPTEWMPRVEELVECKSGYHACTRDQLKGFIGPVICELEFRGEVLKKNDKIVGREARLLRKFETWNKQTMVAFAADCALHVLPFFTTTYPKDMRPKKAIIMTYRYALTLISTATVTALTDAAYAAYTAATDAAYSAANAATAAYAAYTAATDAAYAAANAATAANTAVTAATDAAYAAYASNTTYAANTANTANAANAEKSWQTERLFDYLECRRTLENVRQTLAKLEKEDE